MDMGSEEDSDTHLIKDVSLEVLRLLEIEQLAVEKVRVQAEVFKVRKLSAQFLDKLTFTMCIPQLTAQNYKHLAPYLTPGELAFVKNTMRNVSFKHCSILNIDETYGQKSAFMTASSATSMEDFYANYPPHKENITSKQIEDIWNSVDILYNKPEIRKLCDIEMISQLSENVDELITSLESLIEITILKMFKSPKEENDMAESLARKYVATADLATEIYQLMSKNRPRLYSNAAEMEDGWKKIDDLNLEKFNLKVFCKSAMDKLRDDTNAKMEYDWKVSERKQKKAFTIQEDIQNQYEMLKQEHIRIEKELKEKEQKLQRQVAGVTGNYDREVKKRQKVVDKLTTESEELLSNSGKMKISDEKNAFLHRLNVLLIYLIKRMLREPNEEDRHENEIVEKFFDCEKYPDETTKMTDEIKPNVLRRAEEVHVGWEKIAALERQQKKLKEYCQNTMAKNAKETESKMNSDKKASEKRKEAVAVILKDVNKILERSRSENLKKEKELRTEQNDVESKLEQIKCRYQTDMKKRENTLSKLTRSYTKEMETMQKLKVVYEAQEAKYEELMKEKSDYEHTIWESKLLEIRRKIAARKIQRFYRTYLSFMLAHGKRGKKGRGKRRK